MLERSKQLRNAHEERGEIIAELKIERRLMSVERFQGINDERRDVDGVGGVRDGVAGDDFGDGGVHEGLVRVCGKDGMYAKADGWLHTDGV